MGPFKYSDVVSFKLFTCINFKNWGVKLDQFKFKNNRVFFTILYTMLTADLDLYEWSMSMCYGEFDINFKI